MANYTVDTAKTAALGAGVVDKINFSNDPAPSSVRIEIINLDTTAIIWVAINGALAAVEGDNSVPVLPNSRWPIEATIEVLTLQIISSGTPKYTVRRTN